MKKIIFSLLAIAAASIAQQRPDIVGAIMGSQKAVIAVPDMRGAGRAEPLMGVLNGTLFRDLEDAAVFKMAPKSMYPTRVPQQPQDFRKPLQYDPNNRNAAPWLQDWSDPPVNANYLTFGYAAEQDGQMVLFGWLFNVNQPDVAAAQVFGKIYFGPMDESGARKVAHEFAADVLKQFGVESLAGTKIYFVSNRSGTKEIWGMDYDGAGQKQITNYKSISTMPSVSPDGTRIAFTSWALGQPQILVHSLETLRRIPFLNPRAGTNQNASYSADGKQIAFSSSASGFSQIYMANADGSGIRRLTNTRSVEVEPKINPKTGTEIVFVSGRGGASPQVYRMNSDGADVQRLTTGEGQATNPSWNPQGTHIAFAWTRGYDPGNFNIFVMDVNTREYVQLTSGAGRNENPTWAPDGKHIVFSSNRGGRSQIWSMLADGTQLRQLTSAGVNEKPAWSK
ncbi:MAG: PD40 domain-containing protein [Bryobacterales bacterium]|nr:PD40 domain-containing protein [Bryobacterales bacterium]